MNIYLITPNFRDSILEDIARFFDEGNTMLQLRDKSATTSQTKEFIEKVLDISSKYKVMGSSKYGNVNQYVVINGKILSVGNDLDGMTITRMENKFILLEKDGIKYRINYNQR